jgi:hypothetical protein
MGAGVLLAPASMILGGHVANAVSENQFINSVGEMAGASTLLFVLGGSSFDTGVRVASIALSIIASSLNGINSVGIVLQMRNFHVLELVAGASFVLEEKIILWMAVGIVAGVAIAAAITTAHHSAIACGVGSIVAWGVSATGFKSFNGRCSPSFDDRCSPPLD